MFQTKHVTRQALSRLYELFGHDDCDSLLEFHLPQQQHINAVYQQPGQQCGCQTYQQIPFSVHLPVLS